MKWIHNIQIQLHGEGKSYEAKQISSAIPIIARIEGYGSVKKPETAAGRWVEAALNNGPPRLNPMGYDYICSTHEALFKCNLVKGILNSGRTDSPRSTYFRGEEDFNWKLVSKLGRRVPEIDWGKLNPLSVTSFELEELQSFQEGVLSSKDLSRDIFDNREPLEELNASWWAIMQHYSECGTRLLDVTSSIFTGLYFAYSNFNSTVNTEVDGSLRVFVDQPGRGEREHELQPDCDDMSYGTVGDYFSVDAWPEVPRFRISPFRCNRELAQDGYFIWQPFFDRELECGYAELCPNLVYEAFSSSGLGLI